jgi:mRNA interferase MazF
MRIGEIILIPFPFSELNKTKVRPAVVITETKDKYKDLVVSAISSVVPENLSEREFVIESGNINNLRVNSIVKTDRIVTVKRNEMIAVLGNLTDKELQTFKSILIEIIC